MMNLGYQQAFGGMREVRVRFAPSPTGFLHIGSARTALFNWLFARKNNGVFVLRIEDTDLQRSQKVYEKDIIQGLQLLGLDWDEGPDKGGEYGPYRQSERKEIYIKYTKQLLDEGKAFRCFCSKEEILARRQDMAARGEVPRYSGGCDTLSNKKVQENLLAGMQFVVRLKMPNQKVSFDDLIRGKITFSTEFLGDIAISRGIDNPLYNYAVVIDDYEMKISHIIRGEDHISNTPKQIMIQKAFGWDMPVYAHLPLILGPDRAKLSKRHGATSLKEYITQGYLPEALINFLVLLGWHPSREREIFTLNELIEEFSLDRVQKSGAVFNINRLNWFNNFYLRKKTPGELESLLVAFLIREGFFLPTETEGEYQYKGRTEVFTNEYVRNVAQVLVERIQNFSDFIQQSDFFFNEPQYDPELLFWKQMTKEEVRESLQKTYEILEKVDEKEFTKENLNVVLEPSYGLDRGTVLWPFRVALSGKDASPPPFEIAEIIGKKKTLQRLQFALGLLQT